MAELRSITEARQGKVLLSLEDITVSDCPFGGLWLENERGEGMQVANETMNKLLRQFFNDNF